MDEQTRFRTALSALKASGEQKNRILTQEEVQCFFQDMDLKPEQHSFVYDYLASQRIQVEGRALPKASESEVYTQEELEFLDQYKKELRFIRRQPESALPELFAGAAEGEVQAKKLLTEHYMEKIPALVQDYAGQGLLLQDLIQEGSLGLMTGIDTLGLLENGCSPEEHLENEIHKAIKAALDEQEGADSMGEQITERLNKLADSITELTEELGRQVTPEELSVYLDMPVEEIAALVQIAGESVELAGTDDRPDDIFSQGAQSSLPPRTPQQ